MILITLLHIKAVGEEVSICYQFVGWDVVDEFDVVWKFLNCKFYLFVFDFTSPLLLSFAFNLIICSSSFINFSFNLPFFGVGSFVFCKRLEFRCSCATKRKQTLVSRAKGAVCWWRWSRFAGKRPARLVGFWALRRLLAFMRSKGLILCKICIAMR